MEPTAAAALASQIFWIAALGVAYTYVLYPLTMALLASVRRRAVARGPFHGKVSVVIAARNEEARIGSRVTEFLALIDAARVDGEVIVVSDGSTDGTAARAAAGGDARVQVVTLSTNAGKAAALSRGCLAASGDVLVFADARQHWHADALINLLRNFADTSIGGASGDLVIQDSAGVVTGVGLYWKYERWLRRTEARFDSTVGVSGSISAVRRSLFRPIPPGTLLDDVYWPMQVVLQGFRVTHDDEAIAYDRLPERVSAEFRRKVRTLSGNFQVVARLPALLAPWRNRLWFQFVSHKLMRLVVPWLLLLAFASSFFMQGLFAKVVLAGQLAFYGAGIAGLALGDRAASIPLVSTVASFLMLNAAAWMGFWVWIGGRAESAWNPTAYDAGKGRSAGPAP
jgi:cellulose synthase/poly-beta-1,6-N-acetylglucosamine synthase-like glycosyltransferase